MPTKITKDLVQRLQPGQRVSDHELKGLMARCRDNGTVTFVFNYRDAGGAQRSDALGKFPDLTVDQARTAAKILIGKKATGVGEARPLGARQPARPGIATPSSSGGDFEQELEAFFTRHVRKKNNSAVQIEGIFARLVTPTFAGKRMGEIRRAEVIALLDHIEDNSGPVMADRTLAHLRKFLNWYAIRDEAFHSPIVKGMARSEANPRDRFLTEQELRDLWRALDREDPRSRFPALVRCLLLTGQRRSEVAGMHRRQIDGDTWNIAKEDYKTEIAQTVPLSTAVQAIIGKCGRSSGYLFSADGKAPFSGFSKCLYRLVKNINALRKAEGRGAMPHWTLHDLRRTARTYMPRAGVTPDTAERVLGHVITGVRGVYDQHDYLEEKRRALEALAELILGIVTPTDGKVVRLPRAVRRSAR